jgi:cysteine desulfurase family protein
MIYFDNAATTKYKPEEVYEAVNYYLKDIGVSPGRGSYSIGIEASRMLYKARNKVGKYFGLSNPDKVVFTKNSTEAINLFFNGYLKKGDHVIISCYEHNAVLRPIQRMKDLGIIDYSVINRNDLELSAEEIYDKYVTSNTRLIAMTLASNLTGRIIFRDDVFQFFKKKGVTTFVDSSQGAGKIPLNMKEQYIDFLAFTGHKDLLAVPGVGGLCCESQEHFEPLLQGGTGIHGESYTNPPIFPEGYEAGTLNMPAIWSLYTSIDFINKNRNDIEKYEKELTSYLLHQLGTLNNVVVYDVNFDRVSTCSINVQGLTSDKLVLYLDENGICVRGGIHCAILAHEAIGTVSIGTVRISLSYNNTKHEIDRLIELLKKVGE